MRYFWIFWVSSIFAIDFSIIVPSYNNEKWCEWNLNSILSQSYADYTVYYIDDASTDGTWQKLQKIIKQHPEGRRVKTFRNKVNKGALANIYFTAQLIPKNHVIVLVDGDDALAHKDVLKYLACVYQDQNVWLTYGQFQEKNSKRKGFCANIPNPLSVRSFKHVPSHLKTFYAWLFKKVKVEDLTYKGKFFEMCSDLAMMIPMIEMGGKHSRFIPDILYIYNDANPLSDHRKNQNLQRALDKEIRKRPRYQVIN